MSNLPDLNKSQVSFIAYWNAIDQGGDTDISPSNVANASRVNSMTTYDNGVEGKYEIEPTREANFRVKDDGWMLVWLDQTAEFDTFRNAHIPGPWDIHRHWNKEIQYGNNNTSMVESSLERALNELRKQLDSSDVHQYSPGDVGLYNYQHPDATGVACYAMAQSDSGSDYSTGTYTYTGSTTRYANYVYAAAEITQDGSAVEGICRWRNLDTGFSNKLVDLDGSNDNEGYYYTTVDIIQKGWHDSSGDEAELGVDADYGQGAIGSLALWG